MKVIAKFSVEEWKCIPELLSCTSKPCGWTVPERRQQNVSKSPVMKTTVKETKPEPKGFAGNLFYARAEHLKELNLERNTYYPISYNFHCYVFNPANIFLIKITLQNIDIVTKNYILVTDCRKIKVVHFLDV